ncbi:unnamed protein product [Didymodactylos carnosus]|uniref:WWE domain-containing protein n=1 Tax=Didymodactylos carnosus TaxID=1234261 RepID=A0A815GV17_9BILA|nr:unnamed protein product [Didymodactylos carnosus]CAF4206834.1 unnamed protein product [Didymodactylos carnosus]
MRRGYEKETWGRQLVIQTPANVTDKDIIQRYGADMVITCSQLNKPVTYQIEVCQTSFPITIIAKRGPMQKFVQTTIEMDDEANVAQAHSRPPSKNLYLVTVVLTYEIDYQSDKQKNMKTSYQRLIERRPTEAPSNNQNWFYRNDEGRWIRYESLVQDTIETAFRLYRSGQGLSTVDVEFPGRPETYQISFRWDNKQTKQQMYPKS